MKRNAYLLASAAAVSLTTLSFPAFAQDAAADNAQAAPADEGDAIVVTGIRASLESAQQRKRDANQIVDSIVADDIGKLPDMNTTEALQRVSGIQVSRDRGEGGSVAIRGLTQVLATLNGREIFTAGGGRSFNLQDFPAELLAGIDIYKTPSSDLVEGGIGGVIDLRTRMPLDLDNLTVSGSLRGRYNDLADKWNPMASGLISTKWGVGDGEMGVLLSGSFQQRSFRADIVSVGAHSRRTDVIAGQEVITPNGTYEPLISGKRTRIGIDGTWQWRPTPDFEIYAQGSYQEFRSIQEQYGLNVATNGYAVVPGSVTLFPGTNDFQSGTFSNVVVSTFGVARDTYDKNRQFSFGGKWSADAATLSADFSYQKSTNTLYYSELDLRTTVPQVQIDVTGNTNGGVATTLLSGVDLTQIGSYDLSSLTRSENHYKGDSYAGRLDGDFQIESDFLSGFKVGVRWAKRSMEFTPIRFFSSPAAGTDATPYADLFQPMPFDDFYRSASNITYNPLVADPALLRGDFDSVRNAIGITTAPAVDPKTIFDINETTTGGYAQLLFKTEGALPIDGNVGVRVVQTQLNVTGNQNSTVGGTVVLTPLNVHSSYVSVLPSGNIRFRLTDDLQLRLSASKTLTRPDFGQLSPSLTLVPANGQASSGNPFLKPLRADQADVSLEYYFSPTGSVYAAGFYRKVKGFIFTTVTPNVPIDGILYNLSQPTNGESGDIKGAEIGGQAFFDFLPGALSGFGIQANYTYVDSKTPSAVAGFITPLPNLSKHSFNISGLYEKGGLSARVAYNYRSKFYQGLFTGDGNVGLVYRKGYGWLDASINYDVTPNITVSLEGSNLLRTAEATYYVDETRPGQVSIDDRQFLAGVRFKF
ncbi:TonB-dependent receptor [Sphingopyxis sp. GW247-27LB]|uniref:TonB-dependent receptor n=1 Tax=Sphingopyxis sp. GW247-27LB TaxID=2012632 RepID=UPI000BA55E49|nr:TonB-dependent receptor [Sphingopyxis sp. GW247-27LB]PAL21748.1 TonB-dependent receptor [Sphingopyxis sp. GW247-27LB]